MVDTNLEVAVFGKVPWNIVRVLPLNIVLVKVERCTLIQVSEGCVRDKNAHMIVGILTRRSREDHS